MTIGAIIGGATIGASGAALLRRIAPPRCAEYTSPSFEPQRFARVA